MISLYGSNLTDVREGLFIENSFRIILQEFAIKSPSLISVKSEPYNEIMLYKKQKKQNKKQNTRSFRGLQEDELKPNLSGGVGDSF